MFSLIPNNFKIINLIINKEYLLNKIIELYNHLMISLYGSTYIEMNEF